MTRLRTSALLLAGFLMFAGPARAEPSDDKPRQRTDRHGDPLPPRAIARLGTVRLRHSDMVILTAFLPGDKALLTVAADGTVCQWDVATGKELSRFKAIQALDGAPKVFGGPVHYATGATMIVRVEQGLIALSPDCKTLAAGSLDGSIHLWDIATGKELRYLGKIGPGIIFAPDGKTFIARGL